MGNRRGAARAGSRRRRRAGRGRRESRARSQAGAAVAIATRVLKLRAPGGEREVRIRIFAPEQRAAEWACRCEIGWPAGAEAMTVFGGDAVQALLLALQTIGVRLYLSEHHEARTLAWGDDRKGYGFPVTISLRDLLVGEDRKYF
jgi:hypothetical protein